MRKRDVEVGLRVEITDMPFKGTTGVAKGRSRPMGVMPVWEIWCDHTDDLGRQLVWFPRMTSVQCSACRELRVALLGHVAIPHHKESQVSGIQAVTVHYTRFIEGK